MTTAINNDFLVTKENFHQVVEAMTYVTVLTSNYNRDCFGMSDIRLAMRMEALLDEFITRVMKSGYCAHALMDVTMRKHEMWIKEESKRPDLKQELDNALSIDLSDLSHNVDYCMAVFKQKNK